MVKISSYLDNLVGTQIKERNDKERENHKSSGKLSASSLNDPLQWQILHSVGVEGKTIDDYTLRKFLRGKQVEDWYVSEINPIEKQKFVEYRNCVGYIDAIMDTKNWDVACGIIPFEIKSVSNMKYKRIDKQGADKGHILQACFYAMALGKDNFAVSYVATDDYRIKTFMLETATYKNEVDEIITTFDEAKKVGGIPKFEAREKWQENLEYCKYPDWMELDEEELAKKYKLLNK